FVDIGAHSAEEVATAGVKLLDPVVLNREQQAPQAGFGSEWDFIGHGNRFGLVALVTLPEQIDVSKLKGKLTIALVTQQWTGSRGLDRILEEVKPDELLYVGRLTPAKQSADNHAPIEQPKLGSGVLIGSGDTGDVSTALSEELRGIAEKHKIAVQVVASTPPRIASYSKASPLP